MMLERVKITAGATWHNTGLLWSLLPKDIENQLLRVSRNLILRIHEETGVDPNWHNNGGIYVARTKVFLKHILIHHLIEENNPPPLPPHIVISARYQNKVVKNSS